MSIYKRIMPPTEFDSVAQSRFERYALSRLKNSYRWKSAGLITFALSLGLAYVAAKNENYQLGVVAFVFLGLSQLIEHHLGLAYYRILVRIKEQNEK